MTEPRHKLRVEIEYRINGGKFFYIEHAYAPHEGISRVTIDWLEDFYYSSPYEQRYWHDTKVIDVTDPSNPKEIPLS